MSSAYRLWKDLRKLNTIVEGCGESSPRAKKAEQAFDEKYHSQGWISDFNSRVGEFNLQPLGEASKPEKKHTRAAPFPKSSTQQ